MSGAVTALAADGSLWCVVGDATIATSPDGRDWEVAASIPDLTARCVLPVGADALVGTSEAGLFRVRRGGAERISGFDVVRGRDDWYTPWGGPPDTRSLARDPSGTLFANVHVGGIPRSADEGTSWEPTIDVDEDVHQVIASGDLLLAACAHGLAVSRDRGESWRIDADGLHGPYCRATAVCGDTILVSASTGPFTRQAAVYRRPLASEGPLERCLGGLPEWFGSNIDTHCLAATDTTAALSTGEGDVWLSTDQGATWELAARGLPGITSLAFATPEGVA